MNEYEHEPVRGLPEYLPEGETLLWQGQPGWRSMALRVFHVRSIGLYFGLLVAIHLGSELLNGAQAGAVLLKSRSPVDSSIRSSGAGDISSAPTRSAR